MLSYSENIQSGLLRFLTFLARTLLRAGVGYKEFELVAKRAFIDVAAAEFGLRGRETNTSRIAVMTGLTRKEVAKLRNASIGERALEVSQADVLHRWYTDALFLDRDKNPLPLWMNGPGPNFAELVRSATSDLPVGAVRVELERVGAIGENENGQLIPHVRVYKPRGERALALGIESSLSFLMSSIEHNLDNERIGVLRPERVVVSNGVPAEMLEQLRSDMNKRITEFTEDIDDWFASVECDRSDITDIPKVGVGVYYFEEPPGPRRS